jgi:hypothetical protein
MCRIYHTHRRGATGMSLAGVQMVPGTYLTTIVLAQGPGGSGQTYPGSPSRPLIVYSISAVRQVVIAVRESPLMTGVPV